VGPSSNSSGVAGDGAAAGSGPRKLPSSLAAARSHTSSNSTAGSSSGGSGGSCYPPQQQQQAQQRHQGQQQQARAARVRQLPWAGRVRYACTAADVDAACRQLLAAGPPTVIGFDVEWKPSFVKGSPPNKAALVQLAYACEVGTA